MEFLDAKEEKSRCGSTRATRGKGPYDEAHSRTAVRGSQEGRGRAVEGQVTVTPCANSLHRQVQSGVREWGELAYHVQGSGGRQSRRGFRGGQAP